MTTNTGWSAQGADPLVTRLIQVATSWGVDYTAALMASVATAKEVHDVDTGELIERLSARCRVAPMVERLVAS